MKASSLWRLTPMQSRLLWQTFVRKWEHNDFEQMCLSPQVTLEMMDWMLKAPKGGCRSDFRAGESSHVCHR